MNIAKYTCALLLLTACEGADPTELLVVVDSDLDAPGEIDEVRVEVTGAPDMVATGSLADEALPRTVGVVYGGGSLGPVRVRAVGSLGGTDVVEVLAITSFVEGRTLVLPMFLSRRCRGLDCGTDMTCGAGNCTSAVIDSSELDEWQGTVPRLDGGPCMGGDETCNEMDDDCDGNVDETFDLETDPTNCGACGETCEFENGSGTCTGGSCVLDGCDAGFDNCDDNDGNGCELDVTSSLTDCGACDTPCAFENAAESCNAGTCTLGACEVGFDNCDTEASTGCETPVNTLSDCNMCGVPCVVANGTPDCATGTCDIESCNAGFDDCDTEASTGCEASLTSVTDCGSCGTPCVRQNATPTCATGMCRIDTCNAGFASCDGMDTNGCEDSITDTSDCGMCGNVCNLPSTNMHVCNVNVCEVGTCDNNRGNCDGNHANGCETMTNTVTNCGICGRVCSGGTPRCISGACVP